MTRMAEERLFLIEMRDRGNPIAERREAVRGLMKTKSGRDLIAMQIRQVDLTKNADGSRDSRVASDLWINNELVPEIVVLLLEEPYVSLLYALTFQLDNDTRARWSRLENGMHVDGASDPICDIVRECLVKVFGRDFGLDQVAWRRFIYDKYVSEGPIVASPAMRP